MPKHHLLAFYEDPRKGRPLRIHRHRPDLAAFCEVQPVLHALGYEFGDIVPNFPPSEKAMEEHGGAPPLLVVDDSFLGRNDVIVVPTRLPLDDHPEVNRIHFGRAFTTLEQKVLDVVRAHFGRLRRDRIDLQPEYATQLREPYRNRAQVSFKQHGNDPWYKQCSRLDGTDLQKFGPGDRRTAAYLLNVPEVPSLRGHLLNFFGPSGPVTLGWAYRLRRDFAFLLREPGFTVVEITGAVVPERPTSLRFFESWRIEIILQARPRVPVRCGPRFAPRGVSAYA